MTAAITRAILGSPCPHAFPRQGALRALCISSGVAAPRGLWCTWVDYTPTASWCPSLRLQDKPRRRPYDAPALDTAPDLAGFIPANYVKQSVDLHFNHAKHVRVHHVGTKISSLFDIILNPVDSYMHLPTFTTSFYWFAGVFIIETTSSLSIFHTSRPCFSNLYLFHT